MAEWVFKGSLKGPQGDPGSDATVTVDSSLSADSENPVQNKVVKAALDEKLGFAELSGKTVITKGVAPLNDVVVYDSDTVGEVPPEAYASIGSSGTVSELIAASGDNQIKVAASSKRSQLSVFFGGIHGFGVSADSSATKVVIDDKTVTSITDAIPDSPTGEALVTDKAVKDYVTSLIATDEEFDSYMGLS